METRETYRTFVGISSMWKEVTALVDELIAEGYDINEAYHHAENNLLALVQYANQWDADIAAQRQALTLARAMASASARDETQSVQAA